MKDKKKFWNVVCWSLTGVIWVYFIWKWFFQKGGEMETFIISVLTSLIVTYTMMHYHIYKVNELYKKYMDFETSSVKKFAEDIISKLPKNSSLGE